MRLADRTQHALMVPVRRLRRRGLSAIGLCVADGRAAKQVETARKRSQRHRGDHDDLTPSRKPSDGEPDRGLHLRVFNVTEVNQ